jgi:hypothetical protein
MGRAPFGLAANAAAVNAVRPANAIAVEADQVAAPRPDPQGREHQTNKITIRAQDIRDRNMVVS